MPTYDYACQACGHALEIFHSMKDAPKKKCPKCGKLKLERQIGRGAGVIFKGAGFYTTDYRSDSYKKGEQAASSSTSSSSKSSSSAPSSSTSSSSTSSSGSSGESCGGPCSGGSGPCKNGAAE